MSNNKTPLKKSIAGCAAILLMAGCTSDGISTSGASVSPQANNQTIKSPVTVIEPGPSSSPAPSPSTSEQPASNTSQNTEPAPAPPPATTTKAS